MIKLKRSYTNCFAVVMLIFLARCQPATDELSYNAQNDRAVVQAILSVLDDNDVSLEKKLEIWVDDLVHMAPGYPTNTDKDALRRHLEEQQTYGYADMTHEIIELDSYPDLVLMRGRVIGTFYPANQDAPVPFRTNNLFVFRRLEDNSLKIWKVIFNQSGE
ncbi:MAG: nuclear transport factor 2 family protein [Bacteroidota bacterium]